MFYTFFKSANYRCQEEPLVAHVHIAGRYHEGHGARGQHQRAGPGDTGWQGCVGQVCASDEQSRE